MADVKFSALATATTSIGTTIAVVEGGISKKIVVASAFDYLLTNDGNGGQPPAPKPSTGSSIVPGYETIAAYTNGGSFTLPAGGTFLVECLTVGGSFNSTSPVASSLDIQIANGGAIITSTGGVTAKYRYYRLT